jgi:uncharacterized protein (DUF1786 family)
MRVANPNLFERTKHELDMNLRAAPVAVIMDFKFLICKDCRVSESVRDA